METERQPTDRVMMLLAAVVVLSPVFAIVAADWTDGLEVLWLVALVGMVAGWLISLSRFRSLTAHLLSAVYGAAWIGYLLAGPLPYSLWRDRILVLYVRLAAWIELTVRGGTGRDSLLFILLLSVIVWWLGYTAIWNTVRYQRVWRAVLPSGIVLFVNLYYYPGSKLTVYLMAYLLCSLLLVVRSYTALQERRWEREGVGYNSDVRVDVLRSGLVLAVVTILLAWVAPTAASSESAYDLWRRVGGPWQRIEDNFNRMFSTLRSQSFVQGNPFGRTLTLRGPRVLRDVPVLQIVAPSDNRYYWRGVVFDRYTGGGWINTDDNSVQLDAWQEPKLPSFEARESVTQTVTVLMPADTLIFAASQPRRVSVAIRADANIMADGVTEMSQLITNRSLMKGMTYQVVSSLSAADEDSLRASGTDYPAWVRDRYLQLPDSLPQSVRAQAQSIAGTQLTAYDKASAIEAWLRANITYDDQTPAPPQNEDGVAYVLRVRRGYCDYYASAMVVMLRSLGVPARLAVGYAAGVYDPINVVFLVKERDAHSWVEVFFPKYGWVEFEPTASQPLIPRPKPIPQGTATPEPAPSGSSDSGPRPTRDPNEPEDAGFVGGGGAFRRPLGTWVWVLAAVVAFLAGLFAAILIFERRGLGGLSRTAQMYARLLRFAGWLRVRWRDSQTPHERGLAFANAVPDASQLILQVTDNYTCEQYSLTPPANEFSEKAWREMSPQLWLAGLRLRFDVLRQRVQQWRRSWEAFNTRMNRQFE
jgi:transglutaminase-like putative cysteine protease